MPVVRVIVSIDTEEDNWVPVRDGVTTRNVRALPWLERRFECLGVRATYFTNYHVALNPVSAPVMQDIHASGRAEVAAHLHPWNTPPREPGTETMLLNMPPSLQAAKIATVTQQLTELLGTIPRAFRAGRFGLGPSTARALIEAGYAIDSSVTPYFSWERYDHGPSFVGAPLHMYRLSGAGDVRIADGGPLVEVPLSSGYTGWSTAAWPRLHRVFDGASGRRLHLPGIAARTGMGRLVILSPEIHGPNDLYRVAAALLAGGLPFLHVFWHSPSMTPGLSPFCATRAEVDRLIGRFERFLELLARGSTLRFVTISEAVSELTIA